MLACENLAWTYANGGGGLVKDEAKAVELFRKACDGGEEDACDKLPRRERSQ
jgi:TPR repeat protein